MRHLELVRRLASATSQSTDVDAVLEAALELLCDQLDVAAGVIWGPATEDDWRPRLFHAPDRDGLQAAPTARPCPVVRSMIRTRTPSSVWTPPAEDLPFSKPAESAGPLVSAAAVLQVDGTPTGVLQLFATAPVEDEPALLAVMETVSELLGRVVERTTHLERLAEAQRVAQLGTWEWDPVRDVVTWSRNLFDLFGVEPAAFDPSFEGYLEDLVHEEDREHVRGVIGDALRKRRTFRVIHRTPRHHMKRWIEVRGRVTGGNGLPIRMSGTAQDITDRRRLEEELIWRSRHDLLTDLPNRLLFQRRLDNALGRAAPDTVAVAVVDVDEFRRINRDAGTAAGDEVLRQVGHRLREVAPETGVVARLSGDEFALLSHPDDGTEIGRGILAAFRDPFEVDGGWRRLSASVGVATNRSREQKAEELLRDASVALHVAKTRGGGHLQEFDPGQQQQAIEQAALTADLRQAIDEGHLEVVYQPVVSLESGRMAGMEALARWHREGHGWVSPSIFIPLAESEGLIGSLGKHVLLEACEQFRQWQSEHREVASDLTIAVNISSTQLDDPNLLETVDEVLARSGLAPESLVLEVTETALPQSGPAALTRLRDLRKRGVRIAIDDFGTGYSSLARLREYPVDVLKIDRSFVHGLRGGDDEAPILQALFSIAHTLDLEVIAEGVETPGELEAVLRHGGHKVQGYLFSRPLPPDAFVQLLEDPTWDGHAATAAPVVPPAPPRLQELLEDMAAGGADLPMLVDEVQRELGELAGLEGVTLVIGEGEYERGSLDAAVSVPLREADGTVFGELGAVASRHEEIPDDTVDTLLWVAGVLADRLSTGVPRNVR